MPSVRPVDVRRETLQNGVSEHLLRAIEASFQRGEQSSSFPQPPRLRAGAVVPVLVAPGEPLPPLQR